MVHFVIVGLLTIASTYYLYSFVLTNSNLLPVAASAQAEPIDKLFEMHWFFLAFFFSLIIVFMLYSIVVFRRKRGDTAAGKHFEGNTTLEIFWTLIPLLIVVYAAYQGVIALEDVERRDPGALEIKVIASQWNWTFEYPDVDGAVSDVMYLPWRKQVILNLESRDVIHSFWVPEFRVKQDILPGGSDFIRQLRITPTETGDFILRCAELCGTRHSTMLAQVRVVTEADFEDWLANFGECETDVECGQALAQQYGCISCHSIDGATIVGPTWQGLFGSSVTLPDGTSVLADETYLITSISDPNGQIREGFFPDIMPQNFQDILTEEEVGQIIEYIKSLSE